MIRHCIAEPNRTPRESFYVGQESRDCEKKLAIVYLGRVLNQKPVATPVNYTPSIVLSLSIRSTLLKSGSLMQFVQI